METRDVITAVLSSLIDSVVEDGEYEERLQVRIFDHCTINSRDCEDVEPDLRAQLEMEMLADEWAAGEVSFHPPPPLNIINPTQTPPRPTTRPHTHTTMP